CSSNWPATTWASTKCWSAAGSASMSAHVGRLAIAPLVGASTVIPSVFNTSINCCEGGCGSTDVSTSPGAALPSNSAISPAFSIASANRDSPSTGSWFSGSPLLMKSHSGASGIVVVVVDVEVVVGGNVVVVVVEVVVGGNVVVV